MRAGLESQDTSVENDIKQEARRLGFVLAGVTTPEAPPHASAFGAWLEAGYHGQMGYLATERSRVCRGDPRQLWQDCRSILVLAIPYPKPEGQMDASPPPAGTGQHGRVAAYARGLDYHDAIPRRIRRLIEYVERRAGRPVRTKVYTDTGPILERDLAQRAGIGWIGKNTCLINPRLGSYLLLAEVLMDLALRPDPAFPSDHCGSCTRCLEACPTECILPNRTVDARRCISYLTIETRDAIPLELRERMGAWLFGCDACQMVCPWNRFAPAEGDADFMPGEIERNPPLQQQLEQSDDQQRARLRASPLKRPGLRGSLRNAIVVAGNVGEADTLPGLARLAQNPDAMIAEHATWALARVRKRCGDGA